MALGKWGFLAGMERVMGLDSEFWPSTPHHLRLHPLDL